MPAVAGGGVVPYGVGGGFGYPSEDGGNAEVVDAIQTLTSLVERFENAVDNMTWVAQFGDVRAVVQEITKVQKQIQRSGG